MAGLEEVILLSSDEEVETPPPKKLKPNLANLKTMDILKQLNKLKEISAAPCEDTNLATKNNHTEVNSITIIIEGDDKSKENENVVNLIDESVEENTPEQKDNNDNNTSSDCLVVGSDSETEGTPDTADVSLDSSAASPKPTEDSKSTEQNGTAENGDVAKPIPDEVLSRPSTSKASEAHTLLDEFLDTCATSLKSSKYESRVLPKFPKMRKNFHKCEDIHEEQSFKKMLQDYIKTAKISAPEAVVSFQRIYSYLLDNISGASVEVPEDNIRKVRKLEKACRLIIKKLKKLEDMEVDFEDEEDSSYMQMDRYTQRLHKVYNKYCQLLKKNPHTGRLAYQKVQFVQSKYNEINRAITKLCKSNTFPTYYDVEKCIRKCVTKHELVLSEADIKDESKTCFETMGRLLQMRRKKDLYDTHCGYITLSEDPATKDPELKTKLQESQTEGEKRLKEIVEKFVKLQENNANVELSEDSDDSDYKNSDSDAS